MSVTQAEIAAVAGVSQTTVSLVLSGRADQMKISEQAIQRIQDAIQSLGYHANSHAQALVSGRSMTLGMMILPDGLSQNSILLTSGALLQARKRGYDLMLLAPATEEHHRHDALSSLAQRRVDALLIPYWKGRLISKNHDRRWPLVLVSQKAENGYPGIAINEEPGIRAAVQHLSDLGHQKLLYLGWRENGLEKCLERWNFCQKAADELGLAADLRFVSTGATSKLANIDELTMLFRSSIENDLPQDLRVTAVLCYNDALALALYAVLARRGIRIPEDVSVIGYDDWYANCAVPAMTTISQMTARVGAVGVDLAIQMLEEKQEYPCEISRTVDAELVVRQSTGPVK